MLVLENKVLAELAVVGVALVHGQEMSGTREEKRICLLRPFPPPLRCPYLAP